MAKPEIYYYLRRMDEDLQDELKPKLNTFINLERMSLIGASRSASPRVGLVHASQRHNADLRQKIQSLHLDLIIFLIQGAGKPKEASQKIKEEFPDIQLIWECGTEYFIEYFDKFEQYIRANSVRDWQLQDWMSSELKQLSALALLCQGYLVIQAAWKGGEKVDSQQFDWMNQLPEPGFASVHQNLKSKYEQVCQASWWLNVFGLWDEENRKIVAEKWTNFERSLAEEWGAVTAEPFPEVLRQFLEVIHNRPAELKQPERVANAYRAIASVLENKYVVAL